MALEHEFRASIVAVAAAAFAIDSFYGSVIEHAPKTKIEAKSRNAEIFETLKHAFVLTGEHQEAFLEPLRMMFRLRDEAVHPPTEWVSPVQHPAFNLAMEPRFVKYRAENAVTAQFVARKLVRLCLTRPKPEHTDLTEWCEAVSDGFPDPPPLPAWVRPEPPTA